MSEETFLLKKLVDILSPRGMSKLNDTTTTPSIEVQIRQLIIESSTKFAGGEKGSIKIKTEIEAYFLPDAKKPKDNENAIEDFVKGFHILSKNHGYIHIKEYPDGDYWVQGSGKPTPIPNGNNWTDIFGAALGEAACDVVVIVARDPYMTPADAKTEDIEIFLNYMPPILVNQMVPYLDVELAINRSSKLSPGDDLENEFNKQTGTLNTPSLLRFLLGSISRGEGSSFTDADKSLIRTANEKGTISTYKDNSVAIVRQRRDEALAKKLVPAPGAREVTEGQKTRNDADIALAEATLTKAEGAQQATLNESTISFDIFSGMEMFLAPQALTNMDTLKSSGPGRLIQVKPFLPFASIMNFDVSILNAGAGAMATKTAKLQIKVHDKSRIAEFSEFIKGPAGYATAKIWTSYGWLCPRNSTGNDEYAKLVNDKMFSEDCWTVKNTQFTIAPGGDVVLNLDLVSFGVTSTKRTSITFQDKTYQNAIASFQRITEEIEEKSRVIKNSPLGPDARITQILNAATNGNMLPTDIKDPSALIQSVIKAYIKTGQLTEDDGNKLIGNLETVLSPWAGRLQQSELRSDSISKLLNGVAKDGSDPFIPKITQATRPEAAKAKPGQRQQTPPQTDPAPDLPKSIYFHQRFTEELGLFINPPPIVPPPPPKGNKGRAQPAAPAANPETEGKALEMPPRPEISTTKIISFGKLFTKLAVPAILNANDLTNVKNNAKAEIQIIFYTLNDECGPVSGQSIAEFPIDLKRLSYAIDDMMNVKNKYDFTVEEFLKVVINNQFNDDRSIGYGMLSKGLFKPFDKDRTTVASAEKNSAYETGMAAWQAENAGFRKPMIEMFMETAPEGVSSARRINKVLNAHEPAAALPKDPIIRVHIYDKQNNPRKLFTQIIEMSEGLQMGTINGALVKSALSDAALKSRNAAVDVFDGAAKPATGGGRATQATPAEIAGDAAALVSLNAKKGVIESALASIKNFKSDPTKDAVQNASARKAVEDKALADLAAESGIPSGKILKTPKGDFITTINKSLFGNNGIRAQLSKFAPTLDIGANGTLIKTVQLTSKTDDLMAAANLVNIMKPKQGGAGGSTSAPASGLEGPGGLPIRTVPAELAMNIVGCPALRLYQQFFVDLGTGTSFDNLYQVKQISHKLSQGKFETSLTFMYTNGYGKFTAPPTIQLLLEDSSRTVQKLIGEYTPAVKEDPKKPPQNAPRPGAPNATITPADELREAGKKNYAKIDVEAPETDTVGIKK